MRTEARQIALAWMAMTIPLWGCESLSMGTTIVVHRGSFPSVEQAARGEARVNWEDADEGDDTACTECFAAVELQRYLRRMTGRADDFAIIDDQSAPKGELLLVGGPATNAAAQRWAAGLGIQRQQIEQLGPEGYRLRSAMVNGRRVTVVAGGSRVGTLYGAYDLLYHHGCRWFGLGSLHEDIPRIDRLVDLDVTQQPSFATRGFHAWEDRAGEDFIFWMARNRMNHWCVEQRNHPLLRKLGMKLECGGHEVQPYFLNPADPCPDHHPLSYFRAHPEWFGLVGGQRRDDIKYPGYGGTNFCTSNADARNEFFQNFTRALIDGRYRGADVVRLWTLDDGRWCECPECRKIGGPSDRIIRLAVEFAQRLRRLRVEGRIARPVKIRFLVYSDVLAPPTRPLPEGFDANLCIAEFFPIFRCYVHPFAEATCSSNSRFQSMLAGWIADPSRYYRGQLCVGEYYNVSRYDCLPACYMHVMAKDIPYYHSIGARHCHYMHVTTAEWGTKALTNYQFARQLWDHQTDCQRLWSDYFSRRYGAAGDVMSSCYAALESMLSSVNELKAGSGNDGLRGRLDLATADLFPTPHLRYRREPGVACEGPTWLEIVAASKTARALLDRALAMPLEQCFHDRLAEDQRTFVYAERTIGYYHACVEAFRLARSGQLSEARSWYRKAQEIAAMLRADTESVAHTFTPTEIPNAFAATRATKALEHIERLLLSVNKK